MSSCDTTALGKWPDESRIYTFSFANFDEILDNNETIASVNTISCTPTGLTIGTPSTTTTTVSVRISGGTAGTNYRLLVSVITSAANTITGETTLPVLQP